MMNSIARGILSKLVRPDRRTLAEWAEGNVIFPKSPQARNFSRETAPWLTEPLESFRTCPATFVLKTTQGGGTTLAETATVYTVKNRPTDMAIVAQTDKDAEKLFDDKFLQTLKASPATASIFSMLPRYAIKKDSVTLPNMKIQIHGPGEKSTQSATLGCAVIDEVWLLRLLAPSAIRSMFERMTAHPDPHMLCVSQAGEELRDKHGNPVPAEWEQYWRKGSQETFSFKCPCCGKYFSPETDQIRCAPDARLEDGSWNWAMVQSTAHLVTPCCGHKIADTPRNRRSLSDSGRYVVGNPNAITGWRSFRWSCWVVYWQNGGWGGNLVQFLSAVEARKRGDLNPLKEWTMKKEATWWTLKASEPPAFQLQSFGYKQADLADGSWGDGAIERLMGVDVQADRFEVVIREFWPGGKSRCVWTGICQSWEELAQYAARYGCNRKPYRVFVDCGDRGQEVWRECVKRKWMAIRGNSNPERLWGHLVAGIGTVLKSWSKPLKASITTWNRGAKLIGGRKKANPLPSFSWYYEIADVYFEDWLGMLITGQGVEWAYPDDAPADYPISLSSVRKVTGENGRSKYVTIGAPRNHKRDAEKYILAGACILGGIFEDLPETPEGKEGVDENAETPAED